VEEEWPRTFRGRGRPRPRRHVGRLIRPSVGREPRRSARELPHPVTEPESTLMAAITSEYRRLIRMAHEIGPRMMHFFDDINFVIQFHPRSLELFRSYLLRRGWDNEDGYHRWLTLDSRGLPDLIEHEDSYQM
jgi:hypothetical protein